jgi:hypothetical protein
MYFNGRRAIALLFCAGLSGLIGNRWGVNGSPCVSFCSFRVDRRVGKDLYETTGSTVKTKRATRRPPSGFNLPEGKRLLFLRRSEVHTGNMVINLHHDRIE